MMLLKLSAPMEGSTPSHTENTNTFSTASHTADMELPSRAKNMAKKSTALPRLEPAMIPRGMHRLHPTSTVPMVSTTE